MIHIVNPLNTDIKSDLYIAQPITFESMRVARNLSVDNLDVLLVSQQYQEDQDVVPEYFELQPNLSRSILNYYNFKHQKKLPLIKDVLSIDIETDYYIYTNVDIALMPHFYNTITSYIEQGYDAIAINRRTIPSHYRLVEELPLMYSEIGIPHEGIDCFIFSAEIYKKFEFFNSFIGSGPVGLCFIANMISHSGRFIWLENNNLTFHIGDDKSWLNPNYEDYIIKNNEELVRICESNLDELSGIKKILIQSIKDYGSQRIRSIISKGKFEISANPKHLLHLYSSGKYNEIYNWKPPKKRKIIRRIKRRIIKFIDD